jgi:hypothetical protein
MAPRFIKSSFLFEKGEECPKHLNKSAIGDRDPHLWHVNGYDTFSRETYPLASDVESLEDAQILAKAAHKAISIFHSDSGDLRDSVSVVSPEY